MAMVRRDLMVRGQLVETAAGAAISLWGQPHRLRRRRPAYRLLRRERPPLAWIAPDDVMDVGRDWLSRPTRARSSLVDDTSGLPTKGTCVAAESGKVREERAVRVAERAVQLGAQQSFM